MCSVWLSNNFYCLFLRVLKLWNISNYSRNRQRFVCKSGLICNFIHFCFFFFCAIVKGANIFFTFNVSTCRVTLEINNSRREYWVPKLIFAYPEDIRLIYRQISLYAFLHGKRLVYILLLWEGISSTKSIRNRIYPIIFQWGCNESCLVSSNTFQKMEV